MKLLVISLILCFELQRFSFGQDISDCNQIQKFVKEYSSFLKRVPLQTYPFFALCTDSWAVGHYNEAVDAFNEAVKNESCVNNFNRNKLNIVHMLYDQMTNIWETAHCSDCVSNMNDTDTFFNLTDQLDKCIHEYIDPCELCISNYTQVQAYYEGLGRSRKGSICFDIEDRMNQTRYAWSAKYNCCKHKQHSQKAFIWFASGISSLPVLFYVLMYVLTRKKEARERAAMPPLDDQASTVTATSIEREDQQQPSTSNEHLPQDSDSDDDENGPPKSVDEEAKLNNLDNGNKNREGKLIDLAHDGSSFGEDLNLGRPSKPILVGDDDDDDVSILNAMKANVSGRNLLD